MEINMRYGIYPLQVPSCTGDFFQDHFNIEYVLHGQVLEAVISARFLGVDIANNISRNTHVNWVTASANRFLGFIERNLKTKSSKVWEMAYQTFVRPQMEHARTILDTHTK